MTDKELQKTLQAKFAQHEAGPLPHDDWKTIDERLSHIEATTWDEALRQKMTTHTIEPPAGDWEKIAAHLPKKERRMPIWFYYTAGTAASVAIVLALALRTPTDDVVQTDITIAQIDTSSTTVGTSETQETPTLIADADTKPTAKTQKSTHKAISTDKFEENSEETTQIDSETLAENIEIDAQNTLTENHTETIIAESEIGPQLAQNATAEPTTERTLTIAEAERLMAQASEKQTELLAADTTQQKSYFANEGITVGLLASLAPNETSLSHQSLNRLASGNITLRSTKVQNEKHHLPVSVGLSVNIPLVKRLDLITGLQYTYMSSEFNTQNLLAGETTLCQQQLHYVGVPLALSVRMVDHKIFKFYLSVGGVCEKGLVADQHTQLFDAENHPIDNQLTHEYIKGIQGSLNASLGLAVVMFKGIGLYIEPGFAWYIPATKQPQPTSMRTVHPYNLSLTAGLRFNIK